MIPDEKMPCCGKTLDLERGATTYWCSFCRRTFRGHSSKGCTQKLRNQRARHEQKCTRIVIPGRLVRCE